MEYLKKLKEIILPLYFLLTSFFYKCIFDVKIYLQESDDKKKIVIKSVAKINTE